MKVNQYIQDTYLTCGNAQGNYVFYNLPKEFINFAKDSLSRDGDDVCSCRISIDREMEEKLESTLVRFEDEFHKGVMARSLFNGMLMKELLRAYDVEYKHYSNEILDEGIAALLSGDEKGAKTFYFLSPFPEEFGKLVRTCGKVELNLFLEDTKNVYLQRAINNYLNNSSLFPIKVFTTNKEFPTYVSENGQLIQSTHDFMERDLTKYIDMQNDNEMQG